MGRPTGVTLIAVLDFVFGGFFVIGGVGLMLGGGVIAAMMKQSGGQGAGIFAALGAAAGIGVLIAAVICIVIGIGLWKLQNWARFVTIGLAGISGLFQLIGLLGTLAHFNMFALVWGGFWLAIDVLIVWYLLQPQVAAAFGGPQARGATA